jgi:hypothetical protein
MSAFAYISIIEVLGKLFIAWGIAKAPFDKLLFFAVMVAILAWSICLVYAMYCKRNFPECTYCFAFDYDLLKQMFGFAGWNFIGASSAILRDHGGNIILNIFYGPAVNAARAISVKVSTVVTSFVQNFINHENGPVLLFIRLVLRLKKQKILVHEFLNLPFQ